jgi:hypothetical protein
MAIARARIIPAEEDRFMGVLGMEEVREIGLGKGTERAWGAKPHIGVRTSASRRPRRSRVRSTRRANGPTNVAAPNAAGDA